MTTREKITDVIRSWTYGEGVEGTKRLTNEIMAIVEAETPNSKEVISALEANRHLRLACGIEPGWKVVSSEASGSILIEGPAGNKVRILPLGIEQDRKELTDQLAAAEAERDKLREATPPWLREDNVRLTAEVSRIKQEADQWKSRYDKMEEENRRLTAEVEQLTEQLRISRGRQSAANNGAKKMYARWIARGQRIYELENEVKMLKAESHSSGVAEIDKASADTIAALRLHLNEMIDERLGLERKINMLKDEVKRLKAEPDRITAAMEAVPLNEVCVGDVVAPRQNLETAGDRLYRWSSYMVTDRKNGWLVVSKFPGRWWRVGHFRKVQLSGEPSCRISDTRSSGCAMTQQQEPPK